MTTTDSSSYVCDLTTDSDPLVPNGSKMILDLTGDSDSDRSPLEYKNDNTETREVESVVDMIRETTETRLYEWDMSNRFGPCTIMTRTERCQRVVKLDLDPPLLVYIIMKTFPELDGQHIWKDRIQSEDHITDI